MGKLDDETDVRALVRRLRRDAVAEHGVPEDAAARAGAITIRRLAGGTDARAACDARRVTGYFWGVLRRQALCDPRSGGSLRDRYLVAAFAHDLSGGGHAPERVFEELTARFGTTVGPDVLERFRPRHAGRQVCRDLAV